MSNQEVWKDIDGYIGLYQISNLGRVMSLPKKVCNNYLRGEKILKGKNVKGYLMVHLYKEKKMRNTAIHVLIAKAFIDNPDNKPQVNHKNSNITDNNIDNLEWCTCRENVSHSRLKMKKSSKSIGVFWDTFNQRWRAAIMVDKKRKFLGSFLIEQAAADAYSKALTDNNLTNKYKK